MRRRHGEEEPRARSQSVQGVLSDDFGRVQPGDVLSFFFFSFFASCRVHTTSIQRALSTLGSLVVTDDMHHFTEAQRRRCRKAETAKESPSESMSLFSFFLLFTSSSVTCIMGKEEEGEKEGGEGGGSVGESMHALHLHTQSIRESSYSAVLLLCRLLARPTNAPRMSLFFFCFSSIELFRLCRCAQLLCCCAVELVRCAVLARIFVSRVVFHSQERSVGLTSLRTHVLADREAVSRRERVDRHVRNIRADHAWSGSVSGGPRCERFNQLSNRLRQRFVFTPACMGTLLGGGVSQREFDLHQTTPSPVRCW